MDNKKKATLRLLWRDSWKGGTSKKHQRSFWRVHDGTWGRSLCIEVSKSVAHSDAKASILEGSEWSTFLELRGEDLQHPHPERLLLDRVALLMNWSLVHAEEQTE